jgi:hypothetical protein
VADLQSFKKDLQALVEKFDQDKNHYLQKGYNEAQVRVDFLNPFFAALGWDLENKAHQPPDMGPYELLEKVVATFERLEITYLVTGSVAAMAYGEPRLTNVIDIVAELGEQHIAGLLAAFPPGEYYLSDEMIREAIRNQGQFNVIHPSSGLKIDIIIRRNTPFDASRFSRMRRIQPGEAYQANFAAPEDVIIKKMEFYKAGGSEKHLRDITGIIKVSGADVDRQYIEGWAKQLGLTDVWEAILKRLDEKK